MLFKKIIVSPSREKLAQARQIQSQADKLAHMKHKEKQFPAEAKEVDKAEQLIAEANKRIVESQAKRAKIDPPKPQADSPFGKLSQFGRETDGLTKLELDPSIKDKPFGVLFNDMPDAFRLDEGQKDGTTQVVSVTTPATSEIIPLIGQWYWIVNEKASESYKLLWTGKACIILEGGSAVPAFLVLSAEQTLVGAPFLHHLPLGRVCDLLTFKPSLFQVLTVYKKFPVSSTDQIQYKLDGSNAVPVWQTS